MKIFDFDEKIAIKVSPNQLHKILQRLKSEKNTLSINNFDIISEVDFTTFKINYIDILNNEKDIIQKLQNTFEELLNETKQFLFIQEDIFNLKEALFEFNVKHNISKKLSQIEILKLKVKFLQNFKECLNCEKDFENKLKNLKQYLIQNENSEINIPIKIMFYNHDEAKELLNKINKKILELEKEVTLINATNEIEVKINKKTAEIIGLG